MSTAHFDYQKESETFVNIVKELLPELMLDFTSESIDALERFIMQKFDPPGSKYVGESLMIGMGSYIGETIIRNLGGKWSETNPFEINNIGEIKSINPVQKVAKRFKNGPIDSLAHYYGIICKYKNGKA